MRTLWFFALLGCAHPLPSTARFRAENTPVLRHGIPRESTLGPDARARWCSVLTNEALNRLSLPGDQTRRSGPCAVELIPSADRQRVPGVRLFFDVNLFLERPYAAATFDSEQQKLLLPLAALDAPWDALQPTRHEWRHARVHHLSATSPFHAALRARATGPRFQPDDFVFDEVLVNTCDVLDAERAGRAAPAWQRAMVDALLEELERLVVEVRAGQFTLVTSVPEVVPHLETLVQLVRRKGPALEAACAALDV